MMLLDEKEKQHHVTIDTLALAAVLQQPFVDVVLSGAARIEHLHSNLQALNVAWGDTLENLPIELVEPADVY